ncbi:hypothetical protein K7X08_032412 [Anisodus acutangulus]|uniref:Protein GAMETE EXPRESSED 3 n=1 Tax=Anisodus acutangulus TaxID=402998 RepID=A0A9Q1MV81_9SOLA|nr:hypothetical protein K7X08_032412 [Anisodus acutangulus]
MGEEDSQKLKSIAASAYDYENDPRWADYWSNILIPSPMASRNDVVHHFKRKFYQRYIDPGLVVEPMTTSSSSQSARPSAAQPSSSSSTTSSNQPRQRNTGQANRTSGTSTTPASNPTSLRWDQQTIQFSVNAWVFVVAVLSIFPLTPLNLSNRAYQLSFLGTGCSSLYSLYSLYGKPRAWNMQAVQVWLQSVIVTKDFIYFIYCLTFVTSHLYLKFALIPVLCRALEHVAKFLRRNFSRSSLYRKYLDEACVWVESNVTTLNILSSQAEIGLGFLLVVSLLSWQRNIIQTFMYWQILKLMYHAPATAGYHQSVWAKIGTLIYVVAEDRVLKINPLNVGRSEIAVEMFFGTEYERPGEIIGLAVSISSSCLLINVKNRGLFSYQFQGKLHWSAGPVIYQHGYRQGCRKNITECYFSSVPVFDHCDASIYISNNQGEIYSLSTRSPHFKWIQDFSSFGNTLTMTTGNNGLLYVTIAAKALVLAIDVSRGNILWQKSFGPLSTEDYAPAVDSNGWISIGSLDGYLYSFSPNGVVKKIPKVLYMDSVIQVSPVLDCSGYAIYVSQTEIEGKTTWIIGDYTYISAMKPKGVIFTLINPATGTIFWSEQYPGQFSSEFLRSDLQYFLLDESVLLTFFAASSIGNPLPCRSSRQKFALSCSQITPKNFSIYTGNKKTILLFLIFESIILIVLAVVVRFCCMFWKKKKLQNQDLGKFLEKRRSLRLQKKDFDRSITELQQKAAEEAIANEVLEKLGNLVKKREGIQRKLSTSYSLGRDEIGSHSTSVLPLSDRKIRSFSFQGAKKESVTLFHTVSDTSSETSWSDRESDKNISEYEEEKSPTEIFSCSDNEIYQEEYQSSTPSWFASSSKPVDEIEEMKPVDQTDAIDHSLQTRSTSIRKRNSYSSS